MRLRIVRADPAGNITLFVLDDVPRAQRPALAGALMALPQLGAEQVGFVCPDGRMEMMGGEFCGNATRAYGMLLARTQGLDAPCRLSVSVSGCDSPVAVNVDPQSGTASAELPLPRFVRRETVAGAAGTLVHLGGIAHFVVEGVAPSETFFRAAEPLFRALPGLEAYGVIFLLPDGSLRPLVCVPSAGTLVWENSCGSGTLAAAIAQSEGMEGFFRRVYRQSGGHIEACVLRRRGALCSVSIGGRVTLGEVCTVDVAFPE